MTRCHALCSMYIERDNVSESELAAEVEPTAA